MDFTAQDASNLLNEAKESFFNQEEEKCYLKIIEHIKETCDQRKNSLTVYIEYNHLTTLSENINSELNITREMAVKLRHELTKKGFNIRDTRYHLIHKSLLITW